MEIKPQELKLGNIVTIDNPLPWRELKGLPFRVTCIELVSDKDFPKSTASIGLIDNQGRTYSQFSEFIKPIELTPEWLEIAKFEKVGNNKYAFYYQGVVLFGYWLLDGTVNIGHFIPASIKYVHQLQNLFYALTGEELAIDKTSLKN